jgi:hypothetical protein
VSADRLDVGRTTGGAITCWRAPARLGYDVLAPGAAGSEHARVSYKRVAWGGDDRREPRHDFDDGRFRFDGAPPCSGAAVMAFVFARCGASLVYFNGATALEIDAGSWRVAATGSVRDSTVRGARTKEVAGSVRLGNRTLWLQGIVDD